MLNWTPYKAMIEYERMKHQAGIDKGNEYLIFDPSIGRYRGGSREEYYQVKGEPIPEEVSNA